MLTSYVLMFYNKTVPRLDAFCALNCLINYFSNLYRSVKHTYKLQRPYVMFSVCLPKSTLYLFTLHCLAPRLNAWSFFRYNISIINNLDPSVFCFILCHRMKGASQNTHHKIMAASFSSLCNQYSVYLCSIIICSSNIQ